MKKQKILLIVTMIMLGVLGVALGVLYALDILSLLLFGIFIAVDVALLIANVVLLIRVIKKIKKAKLAKNMQLNASTGNYLQDLYGAIGIPVQYNKDGSIKDIYDLLGIEPMYDENGNRLLTPYELLAMLPRFNENGEEIPVVFAIKNRIGSVAKVDLTQRVLTRKLSDTEKEELLIRETLQKKLDEAVQTGDKQKEQAIKKVIETTTNKKSEEKKSDKGKPIPVKAAKGKIIKTEIIAPKYERDYKSNMFDKFFGSPKKEKKEDPKIDLPKSEPKKEPKPEPKKEPKPKVSGTEKPNQPKKPEEKVQLPVNGIAIVIGGGGKGKGKEESGPIAHAIIDNTDANKNKGEDFQPGM